MTHRQEILGAVYNCPQLLPSYFKSYNPILLTKILNGLLNRRVGIEIECCGHILSHSKHVKVLENTGCNKYLTNYYKVFDFNVDHTTPGYEKYWKTEISEHRISILGYTQLIGLYNILNDMKESCLYSQSGIHVHIDISDLYTRSGVELIKYFKPYLNTLENIAGPYSGKYNAKQASYCYKSSWINITAKPTVEFRIAPISFEYSDIVRWIIKYTRIVNDVKKKLNIKTPVKRFDYWYK